MINVNWDEAQAFVRWLSAQTGADYRLLSEAEWEYAARAGTETKWWWGDDASVQCRYANGRDQDAEAVLPPSRNPYLKFPECRDGHVYTAPLGSLRPNPFGLYDMLGNVAEWTEDCWRPGRGPDFNAYEGAPDNGSAWIEGPCTGRVRRGGSWGDPPELLRAAARMAMDARPDPRSRRRTDRSPAVGFRVARDLLGSMRAPAAPKALRLPRAQCSRCGGTSDCHGFLSWHVLGPCHMACGGTTAQRSLSNAVSDLRSGLDATDLDRVAEVITSPRAGFSVEYLPEAGRIDLVLACAPSIPSGTLPVPPEIRSALDQALTDPVAAIASLDRDGSRRQAIE